MTTVTSRADAAPSRARRRGAMIVTWLLFYVVACYLMVGPLTYPFRDNLALDLRDAPQWLLMVPALLFGLVGFWAVVLDVFVAALAVVVGVVTWSATRASIPARASGWLLAATFANAAVFAFALTPLGHSIQIWVLD